ncbi:MAG TPA: hypothetical protein VF453_01925 [Burkholderiaceae bacterium]
MPANPLRVQMHVDTSLPKRVLVTVVYDNVSDQPIWIEKDGLNLFVYCEGAPIMDIGPSEKRRAPTLADFEQVAPGKSTTRQADIAQQFDWRPGRHVYTLKTSGSYDDPVAHRIVDGPAVKVEFSLSR